MQAKRGVDDLRLVVMSATLDAAKFVHYFPEAKVAYLQVQLVTAFHLVFVLKP